MVEAQYLRQDCLGDVQDCQVGVSIATRPYDCCVASQQNHCRYSSCCVSHLMPATVRTNTTQHAARKPSPYPTRFTTEHMNNAHCGPAAPSAPSAACHTFSTVHESMVHSKQAEGQGQDEARPRWQLLQSGHDVNAACSVRNCTRRIDFVAKNEHWQRVETLLATNLWISDETVPLLRNRPTEGTAWPHRTTHDHVYPPRRRWHHMRRLDSCLVASLMDEWQDE
jgi:hypothetical protein